MTMQERIIKKQEHFSIQLDLAVRNEDQAQEVEAALRFALRYFPEQGIDTGRRSPLPVYSWVLRGTEHRPPLIAYYCFNEKIVILMDVHVTRDEE